MYLHNVHGRHGILKNKFLFIVIFNFDLKLHALYKSDTEFRNRSRIIMTKLEPEPQRTAAPASTTPTPAPKLILNLNQKIFY
jgi:hypothetical protein